jgi:predicted AAA+ superfamily ATPase
MAAKKNYWRTKDKAEVDFIVHTAQGVVPVEVKFINMKKTAISRSFKSFLTKYKPKIGFIVNFLN